MTVAPDNRLYVVVGVIRDKQGKVLIQQRREGTPEAGKWEFPGGKLETGENLQEALARELHEELGITVTECQHLVTVTHDYAHANVWLDTYLVTEFATEPAGKEGQKITWSAIDEIDAFDLLPAVYPILEALLTEEAT